MSVDKSRTPAWMKAVIIVIAVAFVLAGAGGLAALFTDGTGSQAGSTGGGTLADVYQPRVDAALVAAQGNPNNPDIVVQVGHAYYEWAAALYESGQQSAAIPFWLSAVTYYDQVLALRADDNVVLGNKAFALYYAQSADAPAALQAFISAAAGNTQLAAQVANAEAMLAEYGTPVTPPAESEETTQ
jgi:hypothetical protein